MTNYLTRWFGRKKKTLAEELAEACDTIVSMAKRGERLNEAGEVSYKYLRILDLANGLRGELLQRGILCIPNDTDCDERGTLDGMSEYRVRTDFTFTNGRESLVHGCYGVGRAGDGTAMSIAQTMALKALLKRMGLIFGVEDDQEFSQLADDEKISSREHNKQAKRKGTITTAQMTKFHNAAVLHGKPTSQIALYLHKRFSLLNLMDLPKENFAEAMEWANGTEDLEKTLAASLPRGPQAVVVIDQEAQVGA